MNNRSDNAKCYRASWIVTNNEEPLADALITLDQNQILAIGENLTNDEAIDLGNAVIAPGLINSHTHLEFSGISQPIGSANMEFAKWIPEVVKYRRSFEQHWTQQRTDFINLGLKESKQSGVSAVGEIASFPSTITDYENCSVQVTSFLEILGRDPNQATELVASAKTHVQQFQQSNVLAGVSPHAPYSVHPQIVKEIASLSKQLQFPVAMHLAESRAELELINNHSGPFREMLEQFGLWNEVAPIKGTTILDYLQWLSPALHTLVIHGNYLLAEEIDFLSQSQNHMTVVYCPRTHAYFGHDRHPIVELLEKNIPVAIGTDSRASTPDLSLWKDVQLAAKTFPEISVDAWLPMVTSTPAKALNIQEKAGQLRTGMSSSCTVFPLERNVNRDEVFQAMLETVPSALSQYHN